MATTIVIQNPHTRMLERYEIGGLSPDELHALPLDDRICDEIAASIAPCLPEEFLAAYVIRVGVVEAGRQIIGDWLARQVRSMFGPVRDEFAPQNR